MCGSPWSISTALESIIGVLLNCPFDTVRTVEVISSAIPASYSALVLVSDQFNHACPGFIPDLCAGTARKAQKGPAFLASNGKEARAFA
jgi:hypothetical protein